MTERIQHIIEGIRLKCKTLHEQLVSERSIRIDQESELTLLKTEISILKTKNSEIEEEKNLLKSELDLTIQKSIDEKDSVENNRNEEIDDLVREIEHCINQLKQ